MKTRNIVIAIFTFTILVMGGYTSLILYLTWPIQSYTVAQSGVFGDSFGIVTAFFTSLAFGGLIITVLLQRDELSLQRKELAETRFSNAFFKLLDYYKHNLDSISAKTPENGKIYGIDVLIQQTAKFLEAQSENNAWYIPDSEYMKVYEYQLCLDVERHLLRQTRYMSTLENILALVCEQIDDEGERKRYWKIESPRVLRRLLILREWSHEQTKQIFPRSSRTRCPYGARASQRVSIPMGGH